MTLPPELRAALEQTLRTRIAGTASVTGGCISRTARLDLANGKRAFLKWAHAAEHTPGLFRAEATSLQAIMNTNTVRVPGVIDVVDTNTGFSCLTLEWIEPGPASRESWMELGSSLARLHQHRADHFGWTEDNFIGSLPQSNRTHAKWSEFWSDERIRPQLEAAKARFTPGDRARFEKLLYISEELIGVGDQERGSLLHGDLWNGNVHMIAGGGAAVIDPSSYYGHREVDLAMSKLFAGFDRVFYEAYEQTWPLAPGADQRLQVYQLYYLLVHVNIFGASYVPNTLAVLNQLGF